MSIQDIAKLGDQLGVKFTFMDLINLLTGQPLSIQVDPLNEANILGSGKSLVISLAQNAIQIQLH